MIFEHLRGRRILVFAGHTNKDSGTILIAKEGSTYYSWEAEVNLDIALSLAHDLKIHSNNECQVFIGHGSWRRRGQLAKLINPDAIVSIHCNSVIDDTVRGGEVWYSGDNLSKELATAIMDSLAHNSPIPSRGARDMMAETNPRRKLFDTVPERPCVLVDCGFLSNREDCELLTHQPFQDIVALKIGLGLEAFFEPTLPTSEGGATGGPTADSPDND